MKLQQELMTEVQPPPPERVKSMQGNAKNDAFDSLRFFLYAIWSIIPAALIWNAIEFLYNKFPLWIYSLEEDSSGTIVGAAILASGVSAIILLAFRILSDNVGHRILGIVEIGSGLGLAIQAVQKGIQEQSMFMLVGFFAGVILITHGLSKMLPTFKRDSDGDNLPPGASPM